MSNQICGWTEYECQSYCEGSTNYCGSHNTELRKREKASLKEKTIHKINPVSKKQSKNISEYSREKGPWIEGRECERCHSCYADQIHHKKGRVGFADLWARLKNISLLMDKRFWMGVCNECHLYIEKHPIEAHEKGWSMPRNEIKN